MITPRERVLISLQHQQPDQVPHHFEYTQPAQRKLEQHFQSTDLDNILGNHLARYRASRQLKYWEEVRPGHWRDDFGVVWNQTVDKDIGVVEVYPLKDRSIKGYRFPNPHASYRYEALPEFIQKHQDRFRIASIGFALFERAWSLRGMEQVLVDMLEAPGWIEELLDAITDYNLGVIEELLKYDIDGILFGDDWGQQNGLIFSPRLWRRLIKPRIARMYRAVKDAHKYVFIHTCGKVQELFPDLIEVGVDVFNPFQPDVMDPYQIKKQFGNQLSFYGGISVQSLLPFGTPQQIQAEVKRMIVEVGRDGGFIIAPSHAMPGDIPVENMLAFLECVHS